MKQIRKIFCIMMFCIMTLGLVSRFVPEKANLVMEVQAAAKPLTPKLVSAKRSGSSKIIVKWKSVENADGYYVYRKTVGTKWTRIKKISSRKTISYTDTKRETGIRYYYTVRAYKKSGTKVLLSGYEKSGVGTIILKTPKLLSAAGSGSSKIVLKWQPVAGASGYRIYRKKSTDTGWKLIKKVSGQSVGAYTDTTCENDVVYLYTVRAVKKVSGVTVLSSYKKQGIRMILPKTPSLLSAKITGTNEITFKWNPIYNVTGYRVYRKVNGGKWELRKKIYNDSIGTYVDTNVTPGNVYCYTVRTIRKIEGKNYLSGYVSSGKSATYRIPKPQLLSVSTYGFDVQVHWTSIENADGYRLYRKKEGETSWKKLITMKNEEKTSYFYTDKDAQIGQTYYYTVRGYTKTNSGTVWGKYDTSGKKIQMDTPREPVSIVVNTLGRTSLQVEWSKVTGADGYCVYIKDGAWKELATLSGENSLKYTLTGLKPGTQYTFMARAYKDFGSERVWSKYTYEFSQTTDSEEIKVNTSELRISVGENYDLLSLEGTLHSPTWSSGDESIVSIWQGDTLVGVSKGTTTVKAVYNDEEFVCKVTVEEPELKLETNKIAVGESIYASVEGTVRRVRWLLESKYESTIQGVSNDYLKLETIDDQTIKITGLKPGESSIYVGVGLTGVVEKIVVSGTINASDKEISLNVGEKTEIIINSDYDALELVGNNYSSTVDATLTKLEEGKWKLEVLGINGGTAELEVIDEAFICGISEKIRVTVKDDGSIASANFKLKHNILNTGGYTEGWYVVSYYGYHEDAPGVLYTWTISYNPTTEEIEYGLALTSDTELLVVALTGNPLKSSTWSIGYLYYEETSGGKVVAESSLNMNTYTGQNLTFKISESENMKDTNVSDLISVANDMLVLGFDGWQAYVLEERGFDLQSLGFRAYPQK